MKELTTCSCGKESKSPLCKECFDKGLNRAQFESPKGITTRFVMWTMLVMFIIGLLAAYFNI